MADQGAWRGGFEERVPAGYRAAGRSEPLARALLERAVEGIDGWTVATDGTGWIAVGVTEDNGATLGRIHDLTVPQGRAWSERWCAEQGAQRVQVRRTGGAGEFADYPVRQQIRMRPAGERPELPPGLTVRRLTEEEYPAWYAAEEAAYIGDIVRSGSLTPEQARAKSDEDFARYLPHVNVEIVATGKRDRLRVQRNSLAWRDVAANDGLGAVVDHRHRDPAEVGERLTVAVKECGRSWLVVEQQNGSREYDKVMWKE